MDASKISDEIMANRAKAAKIIQRAWRKHIDMHVFGYYKNIINFKGKGDPRSLLKCVNPREVTFPPNIYYKIFTHRPIVDMCANSPKDYTSQAAKQILPKQIHNQVHIPEKEVSGWYKRTENNGWRALTERPWSKLDLITFADTDKKMEFHYSKLKRRQEVEKRNKQRKIEWMKKMYYEGSLHAETSEPNTAVLIQRATQGLINSAELHGPESVMDWEVDELLKWTNALNFEEYIGSWKKNGTSKSSTAYIGSTFVVSQYDPYEFSTVAQSDSPETPLHDGAK
ncbi:protein MFI isoform X2 [Ambystoma mexicanum]|uniref:protein MFI isoform X2 n=1 Tax=Ambystoma mexicanum TaxID=8296 RepID=UPI0037E7E50B